MLYNIEGAILRPVSILYACIKKMYACNNMVNPNNPVVILRFAILSDSADRGRSIIRVTIWFTFI